MVTVNGWANFSECSSAISQLLLRLPHLHLSPPLLLSFPPITTLHSRNYPRTRQRWLPRGLSRHLLTSSTSVSKHPTKRQDLYAPAQPESNSFQVDIKKTAAALGLKYGAASMRLTRFKQRIDRAGAVSNNEWTSAQAAGDADARYLYDCIVSSQLKVCTAPHALYNTYLWPY
jgi:hypothetical protein